MSIKNMDDLNKLLLKTINETTCYCLGDKSAWLTFNYLDKRGIPKKDIPKKLDVFAMELENFIGTKDRTGLGPAQMLEKAVVAVFCMKLKINCQVDSSQSFPDQIRKIKEEYLNRLP